MATQQENRDKLIRAIEAQKKSQAEVKRIARAIRAGGAEEALVPPVGPVTS